MIRRTLFTLALTLGAAACSSADPAPSASFSGTIAGAPFVPVEATAYVVEPIVCANPEFAGWNMTMVEVQFWSYAGACQDAIDSGFCGVRADARVASVAYLRANVNGGDVPPIVPGTYSDAGTHVQGPDGVVSFFWPDVGAWDGSCVPPASGLPKEPTGGSLALDEVGPTRVRGRAELAFDNGDVLSGTFDAPICASNDAVQCAALKSGCAQGLSCLP